MNRLASDTVVIQNTATVNAAMGLRFLAQVHVLLQPRALPHHRFVAVLTRGPSMVPQGPSRRRFAILPLLLTIHTLVRL